MASDALGVVNSIQTAPFQTLLPLIQNNNEILNSLTSNAFDLAPAMTPEGRAESASLSWYRLSLLRACGGLAVPKLKRLENLQDQSFRVLQEQPNRSSIRSILPKIPGELIFNLTRNYKVVNGKNGNALPKIIREWLSGLDLDALISGTMAEARATMGAWSPLQHIAFATLSSDPQTCREARSILLLKALGADNEKPDPSNWSRVAFAAAVSGMPFAARTLVERVRTYERTLPKPNGLDSMDQCELVRSVYMPLILTALALGDKPLAQTIIEEAGLVPGQTQTVFHTLFYPNTGDSIAMELAAAYSGSLPSLAFVKQYAQESGIVHDEGLAVGVKVLSMAAQNGHMAMVEDLLTTEEEMPGDWNPESCCSAFYHCLLQDRQDLASIIANKFSLDSNQIKETAVLAAITKIERGHLAALSMLQNTYGLATLKDEQKASLVAVVSGLGDVDLVRKVIHETGLAQQQVLAESIQHHNILGRLESLSCNQFLWHALIHSQMPVVAFFMNRYSLPAATLAKVVKVIIDRVACDNVVALFNSGYGLKANKTDVAQDSNPEIVVLMSAVKAGRLDILKAVLGAPGFDRTVFKVYWFEQKSMTHGSWWPCDTVKFIDDLFAKQGLKTSQSQAIGDACEAASAGNLVLFKYLVNKHDIKALDFSPSVQNFVISSVASGGYAGMIRYLFAFGFEITPSGSWFFPQYTTYFGGAALGRPDTLEVLLMRYGDKLNWADNQDLLFDAVRADSVATLKVIRKYLGANNRALVAARRKLNRRYLKPLIQRFILEQCR